MSSIDNILRQLRSSLQAPEVRTQPSVPVVSEKIMDDTELDDGGPRHATGVRKAVLTSPTAVVHVYYDIDNPPPKPSSTLQSDTKTSESSSSASEPPESTAQAEEHWTRFVCLSDTHNHEFPVPDGDVLLHGGDLTNTGELREFERTVEWLRGLPHKKKIIIGGNHDLTLDKDWYERKWERFHCSRGKQDRDVIMELLRGPEAIEAGLVYLQDEEHKFQVREGGRMWSVYGSPWSPEFFDWAFNYFRSEGAALVGKFPKADIILTHGPAYGIFDQTRSEDEVGCEDLRRRLLELRPRLHVSGHIHEARGAHIHTWGQGPRVNQGDGDGLGPEVDGLPWVQYDALFGKGSETIEGEGSEDGSEDGLGQGVERERTVFVNAANWPAGERAWKNGRRVPFGEAGFRPIIVDLREDI